MPASGEQPDVVPDGEIPKVMTKSVSRDRVAINIPDKKSGNIKVTMKVTRRPRVVVQRTNSGNSNSN